MIERCLGLIVIAALSVVAVPTQHAAAAVVWPDAWTALPDLCSPGNVYTEPHNDFPGAPGQHEWDIVGDLTHAAGFWATDVEHLFFRMRVDFATTATPPGVWQFLLDFTADGNVDYSLQLDNKVDIAVELIAATPGSPLFAQVNLSHTSLDGHWSGDIGDFSRIITDTLDTDLGDEGTNDSFVDVAIPWSDFTSHTGESGTPDDWRVYLTTSASHTQVTKDTPECIGAALVAPEPTTLAIWSALGGLGLIAARRRTRVA